MSALSSTATFASPKTKSLRATIPEGIVAYLGIESGDVIEWRMEIEDNQKVVKVRKSQSNEVEDALQELAKEKRKRKNE